MKKHFNNYALLWLVLLIVWVTVVFVVRPIIPGYIIIYDSRFWISFVFIVISFVTNLICAFNAFKSENLDKFFLKLPLITISRTFLIITVIAGSVVMLIPDCPYWIATIVCAAVSLFNAISIVKASWAAETINDTEEKIKEKTSFIKELTSDAQTLISKTDNDNLRKIVKDVYEAIRYSDPISNANLSEIEVKIASVFDKLCTAVKANDEDKTNVLGKELIVLIKERNAKCKHYK